LADSAPACTAKITQQLFQFSELATIFSGLEFAGLLYLMRFASESPGYASHKSGCPTSIHRCGMGLDSSGKHLLKLPLIPLPPASHR
jgi:hypothetical protein